MNSSLLRLPPGPLNSIICAVNNNRFYDSKIDLKSLRLTCRALKDACTPLLYSDMYVNLESFYRRSYDLDDLDEFGNLLNYMDDFDFGQIRFAEFTATYGHLVRRLEVANKRGDSPVQLVKFLEKMPNLEEVVMDGVFESNGTYSNDIDEDANIFFREEMADLLRRASLRTPPQHRSLQRLRHLDLSLYIPESDFDIHNWPLLGFGAAFIIPSLQTLTLKDVDVDDYDLETFSHLRRKTDLKELSILCARMSIKSFARILSFPRALRFLELLDIQPYDDRRTKGAWTSKNQYLSILQQRASLEEMIVNDMFQPVYIDRSHFPKLRDCTGC